MSRPRPPDRGRERERTLVPGPGVWLFGGTGLPACPGAARKVRRKVRARRGRAARPARVWMSLITAEVLRAQTTQTDGLHHGMRFPPSQWEASPHD
jgi:hypothetical protein